jgi:hypothetical protein
VKADPEKYQAELEAGKRSSRKFYRKKMRTFSQITVN